MGQIWEQIQKNLEKRLKAGIFQGLFGLRGHAVRPDKNGAVAGFGYLINNVYLSFF